jgi:hypothetical protein
MLISGVTLKLKSNLYTKKRRLRYYRATKEFG